MARGAVWLKPSTFRQELGKATERAYSEYWWLLLATAIRKVVAEPVLREAGADPVAVGGGTLEP